MTNPCRPVFGPLVALGATPGPMQSGLGWHEFFERLGNGTLPGEKTRQARPARKPAQFADTTTGTDSR